MRKGFVIGAMVAAGGLLLIPGVAAAIARAGRPVARAAMKTGATAYTEFSKAAAEAYEHFEDMAAEVRAEMHAAGEADIGDVAESMEDAGDSAKTAAKKSKRASKPRGRKAPASA